MTNTAQLRQNEFNHEEWKKLYYQTQKHYLRQRLQAIKLIWTGKSRAEVGKEIGVYRDTVGDWIKLYLEGGYTKLLNPKKLPSRSRLSLEEKSKLKDIIQHKTPHDFDIDKNIWTGAILSELIQKEFNKELKDSAIYVLLDKLGLSHQKAHRDYENTDYFEQTEYIWTLKKSSNPKNQTKK